MRISRIYRFSFLVFRQKQNWWTFFFLLSNPQNENQQMWRKINCWCVGMTTMMLFLFCVKWRLLYAFTNKKNDLYEKMERNLVSKFYGFISRIGEWKDEELIIICFYVWSFIGQSFEPCVVEPFAHFHSKKSRKNNNQLKLDLKPSAFCWIRLHRKVSGMFVFANMCRWHRRMKS